MPKPTSKLQDDEHNDACRLKKHMDVIKEGVAEIRGKLDSYRDMRQVSEVVNLQKDGMLKI